MRGISFLHHLLQSKRTYLLAIIFMSSLFFAPFADSQSALAKDMVRETTAQPRFNEVNQGEDDLEYVPNQVLVRLNEGTREADLEALKGTLKAVTLKRAQKNKIELWQISELSVEEVVQRYQNDSRISYIEPNYLLHLTDMVPDDPSFPELWGLHQTADEAVDADIDAAEAWTLETGSDVIVAVLDTGVDYAHEDLAANMWVNPNEIPDNGLDDDNNGYIDDVHGYDFYNDDGDPMDDNNHGTHVAGTIAAVGNNGIGVTGVSWSARIMSLKICNASGACPLSDAILAIEYATLMGAQVSNNSWGSSFYSLALYDAVAETNESDHLFVAAAGNNGRDIDEQPFYPAAYDLEHVISVAATNQNNQLASFSNYGAMSVDVGAPGRSIYSTKAGDTYGFSSGTSMAAPYVAGLASLLWSRYPDFSQQLIKQRILSTVEPIEGLATLSGGKINAYQALLMDSDGDGVDDEIEDAAPHGGDGNQDGELDSQQNHIASLTNINDSYITVVSPVNHVIEQVKTKANPAPESLPADVDLTEGLLEFVLEGVEADDPMIVTLIRHQNAPSLSRSYWHYVPTPDEPTAEWQEFLFDGTTGAEVEEYIVTLHLVDGGLGDNDLNQNGQLHHSGALTTLNTPPTSIQLTDFHGQTSPQGRSWLVLVPLLTGVVMLVRRYDRTGM